MSETEEKTEERSNKKQRKTEGRVLGIEVQKADIVIEVLSTQKVYALVEAVCDEWLTKVLDDGEVYAHMWTVSTVGKGKRTYSGPFEECAMMGAMMAEFDEDSDSEDDDDGYGRGRMFAGKPEALTRNAFPAVGRAAKFEYDMGSTTTTMLKCVYERDPDPAKTYPRLGGQQKTVEVPPPIQCEKTADDAFPHSKTYLFPTKYYGDCRDVSVSRIGVGRCTKDIIAFAECGPRALGDSLFAPAPGHRYGSAADLFTAIDYSCDHKWLTKTLRDEIRAEAICRFVFCADQMPKTSEAKFQKCKNQPSSPYTVQDIFPRQPVDERDAALAAFPFNKVFPRTAARMSYHHLKKADHDSHWFEYKPHAGILLIHVGALKDRNSQPPQGNVKVKLHHKFTSLHALLSAVEALWP